MKTIRSLVPALAIGSALLLAACGGGGGSTSSGAAPATTAAAPADTGAPNGQAGGGSNLQDPAVQQCLAEKGVTLPSIPAGGRRGARNGQGEGQAPPSSAPDDSSASNNNGGNGGGPGGFFGRMDQATRQALQDCGVTFGRGQGGNGNGGGNGFGGAFNDPAVQQCLADKGITLPQRSAEQSPESPRTSIDPATRQAIQDCRAQAGTTTTTG